jgi:outer membrane lipoprotein SlyB
MMKLCIFAGMTVGGIAGSLLGGVLGYGMLDFRGFLLSSFGSVAGVFVGWKIARKLDE